MSNNEDEDSDEKDGSGLFGDPFASVESEGELTRLEDESEGDDEK